MIISDFSKVAYASVHVFEDDIKKSDPQAIENLLRHVTINSFTALKKRFGSEYGELIIATDGSKNFRRDIYPNYKANRAAARAKSDLPWNIIFDVINRLKEEAHESWPWVVIGSDRAEADDVMGVLVVDVANQNITSSGVLDDDEPEAVLLDTRDTDMFQIHYPNVKQWDSRERKFIRLPSGTTKESFLKELIIRGDSGDGVENIFTPLNTLVTPGVRQTACIAKRLDPVMAYDNIFDYDLDPVIKERIRINHQLVSFDGIPLDIRDEIVSKYRNRTINKKMKMLQYLQKHRCTRLIEEINNM